MEFSEPPQNNSCLNFKNGLEWVIDCEKVIMIVQNAVLCSKCDDFIVSKHRHDFVTCECGNISVDGGQEYLRRVGGLEGTPDDGHRTYIDMSWSIPDDVYKACAEAVDEAKETNRNKFGIADAVMRKLREKDRIIAEDEYRVMANYKDELMVVEPDGTVNRYKKVI